ncbi:MAG: RsmE family RNA methyltransferase [Patescibacteria group bacterium]
MRLHRFFIPGRKISGEIEVIEDKSLLNQWRNVFRFKAGNRVVIFDGRGDEFIATIESLSKGDAVLRIKEKKKGIMPRKNLWLFVSLIKKDKLEWVVEKATELGVSHIVPLLSERGEKKGYNVLRLRKIAIEAAEQSGRTTIPPIHEALTVPEALKEHKFSLFVCDPRGASRYQLPAPDSTFGILIGPEGGWSDKEIELFKARVAELISLGGTTLRAETAAIAATTLALFL